MGEKTKLPDNFRRGLSTTAQTVERALDEMEKILSINNEQAGIKILRVYDDVQRRKFLNAVAEMREANIQMIKTFSLESSPRSESRMIGAKAAHLWTVLVDSTAKGLRGFGDIPEEQARQIDFHVNTLLQKLKHIK
ncbi:MAG: hypothetical protein WEF53_11255 [Bacteroidota bacterium]